MKAPTWDDLKDGTLTAEEWAQLSKDEAGRLVGEQWRGTWGNEPNGDGPAARRPRPGVTGGEDDEEAA